MKDINVLKELGDRGINPIQCSQLENLVMLELEGDWKHTHKYCDEIMSSLGYDIIKETAKPSSEDWYSSWHLYACHTTA